jgi:hypothetical protein
MPHVDVEGVSHFPEPLQHPEQAPPPQVQVPLEQDSPAAHLPHAAPPMPHADADWPLDSTHVPFVPPLQHPVGQVVALQGCPLSCVAASASPVASAVESALASPALWSPVPGWSVVASEEDAASCCARSPSVIPASAVHPSAPPAPTPTSMATTTDHPHEPRLRMVSCYPDATRQSDRSRPLITA